MIRAHVKQLARLAARKPMRALLSLQPALEADTLTIWSAEAGRGLVADCGLVPATWQTEAVLRNHDPDRSCDIYVVFAPHTFINDFDGLTVAVTHGSPWRYDAHVPVIFAGHGVTAGRVSRQITPYDIAPTLATYLGVTQPSGAIGSPLAEVLGD